MELPFERQAMKGDPCPKRLDIADTCAYIALKNLYKMYKNKFISRAEAKKEKETIIYNWSTDKSKIDFINRESEALANKIDFAANEFKNNPNVENAEKLYKAFYNL